MKELSDKTPEELTRILQDEILRTRESQNLHDVAVLRFNATLQGSLELSTVTQKEIVQTNQSLREALTEAAKLNETDTELRNQLEATRPADCVLTKWSEWTECDAKCDSGNQHRSRQVPPSNSAPHCKITTANGHNLSSSDRTVCYRTLTEGCTDSVVLRLDLL